jgi:hypothetical protein
MLLQEKPDGVDGIGFSRSAHLDIGDSEGRIGSDSQLDHLVTVSGRSEIFLMFVRRVAGRNENDPFEMKDIPCLPRNIEMAVVNRIERPPQEPDAHRF